MGRPRGRRREALRHAASPGDRFLRQRCLFNLYTREVVSPAIYKTSRSTVARRYANSPQMGFVVSNKIRDGNGSRRDETGSLRGDESAAEESGDETDLIRQLRRSITMFFVFTFMECDIQQPIFFHRTLEIH